MKIIKKNNIRNIIYIIFGLLISTYIFFMYMATPGVEISWISIITFLMPLILVSIIYILIKIIFYIGKNNFKNTMAISMVITLLFLITFLTFIRNSVAAKTLISRFNHNTRVGLGVTEYKDNISDFWELELGSNLFPDSFNKNSKVQFDTLNGHLPMADEVYCVTSYTLTKDKIRLLNTDCLNDFIKDNKYVYKIIKLSKERMTLSYDGKKASYVRGGVYRF